jgi:hypothetical protein
MATQLLGLAQPNTLVFESHVQSVRMFLRDFAELNQLIRGEESSDRMIAWATMDFLSDFNGTPPFSMFGLEDLFSYNLQSLAVRGTIITLLQSLMVLYARNHLPFSDGGLSVNLNDKAPLIQSMLALFQAAYEQNKRMVKTAINVARIMDSGPSGVHSDYLALSVIGVF